LKKRKLGLGVAPACSRLLGNGRLRSKNAKRSTTGIGAIYKDAEGMDQVTGKRSGILMPTYSLFQANQIDFGGGI
jgi:hypothetical protein